MPRSILKKNYVIDNIEDASIADRVLLEDDILSEESWHLILAQKNKKIQEQA